MTERTGGRSTALTAPSQDADRDARRLELVRATVAKNASDDELEMFMSLANRYDLDPFAGEIACAVPVDRETGERKLDKHGVPYPPMMMTTRDGFLAIANRSEDFDGLDGDVVHEKDEFRRNPDGSIHHVYAQSGRGKVIGAWAMVHRKDRKVPTYFFAPWGEYGEPNAVFVKRDGSRSVNRYSPWAQYPSAMILKVAESMALKRAFSLSGLTSEGEYDAGMAIEAEEADPELQAPARRLPPTPELGPHGRVKRQQPGRAATLDRDTQPAHIDGEPLTPDEEAAELPEPADDDPDGQIGFPDHDDEGGE